jgi:hypothetical protein
MTVDLVKEPTEQFIANLKLIASQGLTFDLHVNTHQF